MLTAEWEFHPWGEAVAAAALRDGEDCTALLQRMAALPVQPAAGELSGRMFRTTWVPSGAADAMRAWICEWDRFSAALRPQGDMVVPVLPVVLPWPVVLAGGEAPCAAALQDAPDTLWGPSRPHLAGRMRRVIAAVAASPARCIQPPQDGRPSPGVWVVQGSFETWAAAAGKTRAPTSSSLYVVGPLHPHVLQGDLLVRGVLHACGLTGQGGRGYGIAVCANGIFAVLPRHVRAAGCEPQPLHHSPGLKLHAAAKAVQRVCRGIGSALANGCMELSKWWWQVAGGLSRADWRDVGRTQGQMSVWLPVAATPHLMHTTRDHGVEEGGGGGATRSRKRATSERALTRQQRVAARVLAWTRRFALSQTAATQIVAAAEMQ
jgi:hypothetical protein